MTPLGRPIGEDDLHALIDGQLAHDRAEDVDAYLAAHSEEQARFSQYAAQQKALREAFAEQADGPIPARLRIANLLAQQRRRRLRQLRSARRGSGPDPLGQHRRLGSAGPHWSVGFIAARRGRTHDHR